MKAIELKEGIFWVGAVDWAVRDFHGYLTPRGSSYNNYLIVDEETTLLDAVKAEFAGESLKRIKAAVDPRAIRHIVVNHIEPDHAGGLGEILREAPEADIYLTSKGMAGLKRFFDTGGWKMNAVKTGDVLRIGRRSLMFVETPMIHWPDSMMTYIKEDGILISQDGFGQHIASAERFDDEFIENFSEEELDDAVWDYYANILMPFGGLIKKKLTEILGLGLEINMIAPDHGVIWRGGHEKILRTYLEIADGKADERVVVIYDTMWHGTERMVAPMVEGLRDEGMETRVFKLRATPLSIAVKEFWRARACLIGTPTLNNTVFPPVGQLLYYLKGLRPKNRLVGAFGSYGWAGGAAKEIIDMFDSLGLEVFDEGLQFNYVASEEEEGRCYEFGREFARRTKEYHKKFV